MKTEDFNFDLPEHLIAQTPLRNRTDSKLLILNKETGEIEHKHFSDVIDYLEEGDALVINDTKVIPARIIGTKEEGINSLDEYIIRDLLYQNAKIDLFGVGENLITAKSNPVFEFPRIHKSTLPPCSKALIPKGTSLKTLPSEKGKRCSYNPATSILIAIKNCGSGFSMPAV